MPELEEVLTPIRQDGTRDIYVNLENVSYMDSTGLGLFVGTLKALNQNDKELYILGVSDRIGRLFEITGLKDLMHVNRRNGGRITCNLKKILSKCACQHRRSTVSLIRLTLSGVFSRAGATYDDIEDAKIAVSEAVTNAVKHAYKENNNVGIINIYF